MINIVLHNIKQNKNDFKNQEKSQNHNTTTIPTIQVHNNYVLFFIFSRIIICDFFFFF